METQAIGFELRLQAVQPINLRIAGADLLLAGRFEQWVPLALAEGKGDGEATAQLLIDVTSTSRAQRKGDKQSADLLSFSATDVELVGPQSYRAKGKLRADGVTRPAEALLHNPAGHTPFLIMTLPIDRAHFAEVWSAFEDRAAATPAGDREMRPRAWLRAPELAAA
jgi:hypothetical protein